MRSLRIGFTSPQGGSGVTTLVLATAARVHFYHRIAVAVADCDSRKNTCRCLRKLEDISKADTPAYGIQEITLGEIGNGGSWENEPQVTLYDLAGTMDKNILAKMDYVYIPLVTSPMLGDAVRNILLVAEEFYKAKSETKFRLFLNKCRPYGCERLWSLVKETGMTPCENILITEARVFSKQAIQNNIYAGASAIPTVDTIDHLLMKGAGLYNLESLVIRDIKRPRLWSQQ